MSNSCQNRPRGKRLAAKAISQWEELHDEVSTPAFIVSSSTYIRPEADAL